MKTAKEAALYLGVSPDKIYQLAREKQVAYYQIGRLVRFELADLEAYKQACRVEVPSKVTAKRPTVTLSTNLGNGGSLKETFIKLGIKPRKRLPLRAPT